MTSTRDPILIFFSPVATVGVFSDGQRLFLGGWGIPFLVRLDRTTPRRLDELVAR